MAKRQPTTQEDRFIEGIAAAPEDEALRLVYADWLEEQGDVRAEYLRAEVEHFRKKKSPSGRPKWADMKRIDPVWAALVSRYPFGILIRDLTFENTGPRITREKLRTIEKHWDCPLPADYAAFLLRYNGGRPSKPYLFSYKEVSNKVRFYSTKDRHTSGRPFHLTNVVDIFERHVQEEEKESFAQMMLIGTLTYKEPDADDEETFLALVMNPDEYERIIELKFSEFSGELIRADSVLVLNSLSTLLEHLCDLPEDYE